MPAPIGVLLAAGAGRRMGRPKALVRDRDGTSWLLRSIQALQSGGCTGVVVVLGCQHAEARGLLREAADLTVVVCTDWASGMGASLRTGLTAAQQQPAPAALVGLVDLPDVRADVVRRVIEAGVGEDTLARATYGGVPGHPVLLGRHHWAGVQQGATGDRGARDYLRTRPVHRIECGDLATGHDVDRPQTLS